MTAVSLPDSKVPRVPARMLLGPGPSNAHPRVIQAMMSGMIGYLDPDFMLILDEVGFVPFTPDGARLLFQVCSDRYLKGSLLVTTNLEFAR